MTSADPSHYKMSFSTGGLFLNETLAVARLHVAGEPWSVTISRALTEGATSLPKAASQRRTLREIVNRLSTLTDMERDYLLTEADRGDQLALLWLATCRAYRFVREFATDVLRERYLSFQLDLPLESFDILFAAKAEWDEGLASISPSTRAKLRQVLFRMMREAHVISDDSRIQSAIVSSRLRAMLEQDCPADLVLFPGLARDGGAS
ncbi:DUF1819 family protein [Pseudorhodobacter sp.]|uniref:DUF1819 family protein n=1 Tax=Pseudorhodobacter sp. TaxID=1934400 RepID=UPI0026480FD4|nr:DUF1819 family protein [Pseudorhodobacter sp.]